MSMHLEIPAEYRDQLDEVSIISIHVIYEAFVKHEVPKFVCNCKSLSLFALS